MSGKVLIVDDSALLRRQVGAALTAAGYQVVGATDGVDATTKLADVALIVCDINMPRMSGLELLAELARDTVTQRIPVVMLTTEGHPDLIQRAKTLGAKGWLIKPFKAELLLSLIGKVLA
ncbi:MAG TPA: response regulator [Kofleriaceae bacterium]|jgi:two-component system chemotaxis response regulator CheY|nr:response regulator [Kofleriaceae bacterium]